MFKYSLSVVTVILVILVAGWALRPHKHITDLAVMQLKKCGDERLNPTVGDGYVTQDANGTPMIKCGTPMPPGPERDRLVQWYKSH